MNNLTNDHIGYLHIGIKRESLQNFLDTFNVQYDDESGTDAVVIYDGPEHDSWESWGDKPMNIGAGVQPEPGVHVIIAVVSVAHALKNYAEIFEEFGNDLVPMLAYDAPRGTIAVITDRWDWADDMMTITASTRYTEHMKREYFI